jgi:hypothetical protein
MQFAKLENPSYFTTLSGIITMTLCRAEFENELNSICIDPKINYIHEILYHKEHLLWGKMQ